jgi:bifunctional non-homologous end joining protein LigD
MRISAISTPDMLSHPKRAGFIEPCLPILAPRPPAGPDWLHEIKHDGFRLMARRDAAGTRLLTRNGNDFTARYPAVTAAVFLLRCRSCLIDGEVVVCGEDGIAVFDRLRRGPQRNLAARLFAFDLLELDGKDLRREPIEARKSALARLIPPELAGLAFAEHLEDDGPTVFRHACKLGCEGIVSKRVGSPYRSGRSRDWIKSKNPNAPAAHRFKADEWSR